MASRKNSDYNDRGIVRKSDIDRWERRNERGIVKKSDITQWEKQEEERKRKQQAAMEEWKRQQRIYSQTQMNRKNPQQWATGGKAGALLKDAATMKPQEQKPATFEDWSKVENILDPKSGFNATLQNMPQEDQEYWEDVKNQILKQRRVSARAHMSRQNPERWVTGGKAGALQRDAETLEPKKEQEANFEDWSKYQNILDPNSAFNQNLKNMPARDQNYWAGVREQLLEEQRKEQERQARIYAQYQMNRRNPQRWVTGGGPAALQQGAEEMNAPQDDRPSNFQDWSKYMSVLDPNSRFSQELKNMPEEDQAYWAGIREQLLEERARQEEAERARQERVYSYYQMDRQNPQRMVTGGKAGALKRDAERTAAQDDRPSNFQDWSQVSNVLDENSAFNQNLQNMPAEDQAYWAGVREQLREQIRQQQEQQQQEQLEAMTRKNRKEALERIGSRNPANEIEESARRMAALQREADETADSSQPESPARTLRERLLKNRPENGGETMTEQSAWAQLADPNSRASRTVAQKEEEQKREWLREYQLMINASDAMNRISGAYNDAPGWLGNPGEEYYSALEREQMLKDLETLDEYNRSGMNDDSRDIEHMSAAGLRTMRAELENENLIRKGMRADYLKQEIENLEKVELPRVDNLSQDEFLEEFGEGYAEYLAANQLEDNSDNLNQYWESVVSGMQDELVRLKNQQEYNQVMIKNNDAKLGQIERQFQGRNEYEILTDPNKRQTKISQLSSEIESLRAEIEAGQEELVQMSRNRDPNRAGKEEEILDKQQQLDIKQAELEHWQELGNGFDGDASYHMEWDKGATRFDDSTNYSIDRIYSFLQGGTEYETYQAYAGENFLISGAYNNAMAMYPNERRQFETLYNQAMSEGRQPTEAKAFLDALQPYLNERMRMPEEIQNREMAKILPVASSAGSLTISAVSPILAARTGIGALLGEKQAQDPYSRLFAPSRYQQDVESQIASDLGPFGGFVYQAGMGMLKNYVRGIAAMGTGGAAEAATLLQFAGEAFYNSYQNKLEETRDPGAAGPYALLDAAISTLFEVASVEKMFSDPTDMLKYAIQNIGAEMSEEFMEGTFGPYIQRMFGQEDEWTARYRQIIADGGYEDGNGNWVRIDGNNTKDAMMEVMREWNKQTAKSVASAALSSGGNVMFGATNRAISQNQFGSSILNADVTKGMTRSQRQGARIDNVLKLTDAASKLGPDSEARNIAEDIQNDMRSGKKLSLKKIAQLTGAIAEESNQQIANIAWDTVGDAMKKRLQDAGEQPGNAEALSRIMTNAMVNGQLSPIAKLAIDQNGNARALWNEYRDSEAAKSLREKTKGAMEARSSVMELAASPKSKGLEEKQTASRMKGAKWLKGNDEELMRARGERTGNANEVVAGGIIGDVVGFGVRNYTDENGQKRSMVRVKIAEGTSAREVDITDVKSTNEAGAQVLQFIAGEHGQSIGSELGATLMKLAGKETNTAKVVTDAVNILWSEALGIQAPKTSLSADTESQIRAAIRKDMETADQRRLENRREIRPGQGKVIFNGAEAGTKAFQNSLLTLNKTAQNEANAIATIAKSAGFDVELYYDKKDTANQGSYSGSRGIRINLAGEFNKQGAHRSAVATFAHEVTHNLEANSPEAYKELRKFVVQNLQKNGFDARGELKMIMETYEAHGESLDLYGAMSEMVAKGCEQVLTSEKVVSQLREKDPTLYGKLKQAVRQVIDQIRKIRGDARATSSRYAKGLEDVADQLEKVWMTAYEEALETRGMGSQVTAQMSMQEAAQNYQAAMRSGDEALARIALDSFAARKGYTQRAYHGTSHFGFTEFDLGMGDGTIFVAYTKDVAETYTKTGDVKAITDRELTTMSGVELAKYVKGISEESGEPIESIRFNPETKDFSVTHLDENGESVTETYTRQDLEDMVEGYRQYDNELPEGYRSRALEATKEGIYDLYTRPGKQLVVDAQGRSWRAIPFHLEDYGSSWSEVYGDMPEPSGWKTRDIAAWAKENGYDSVRINNVYDNGMRRQGAKGFGDIGIFFNPSDVKSADLVTQDDSGKEIGLKERFNDQENDIRFAIMEDDSDTDIKIKKQVNSALTELNAMDPIVSVSSEVDLTKYMNEGAKSQDAAYKKWANDLVEKFNREVYRDGLGRVLFTEKGIKKGFSYLDNGPQKAAFTAAPDVIKYGKEINYHEKHKGGQSDSHTFAAKIMLDGKPKIVAVVVRYSENENRYRTHKVFLPDGTVLRMENNKAEVANTPAESFQQEHISSASGKIVTQNEGNRKSQKSIREDDETGISLQNNLTAAHDRLTELRQQQKALKADLDNFNKRIETMKPEEHDQLIREIEDWEKKTGYSKIAEDLKAAEQEEKKARKALGDYIEQRDVAEEQQKIKESGMTEPEWRRKEAIKEYGYTGDFREAGYLLPNGKMLNFSGEKGRHYGHRGQDHRNISTIYASGEMQGSAAMTAFMKDGNIRVMAESPGMDISTAVEPTSAQYTAIRNMAAKFADEEYFNVDLSDERGNVVGSLEYDGRINPARIVNDIKHYFQTGEIREQSTVSMFHGDQYSFSEEEKVKISKISEHKAENILKNSGEIAYAPAQYSFAGEAAKGEFGDDVRKAYKMEKEGDTDEEIREKTHCIRGYNGRWWRILDNNDMKLKIKLEKIKPGAHYGLNQIYEAKELYQAYPFLEHIPVNFKELPADTIAQTSGSMLHTITYNTLYMSRGTEGIEATLQHEIQHIIQEAEFSNRGANVTLWKNLQDVARARIANNDRQINELLQKVGIDSRTELAWGIEFKEDGTIDEEYLFPEELEKVKNMTAEDLDLYKVLEKDNNKWIKLLMGNRSPASLYRDTVGEIEARAASEKTGKDTRINYPESAVAREDYTDEVTSKPGATLNEKDDIDHLFGKESKNYSFMDEMDFDTRQWMENVPEWSVQTEAEKSLLRNFKDLRMKGQLDRERIRKVDAEIARLENMQKAGENRAPAAGATTGTVTVNDAMKRFGLSMDGDRIMSGGTTVGTIKFGVLNVYAPYRDIQNKLKNSGAFEYDEKLHAWTTKQQNIHADNERDIERRLENMRFKKKNLEKEQDATNEKLARITSDEGFGGMMHRQQKIVQDLLYNKTQAEVRDSVEQMEKAAHAIRARIEENRQAVEQIEKSGAMDRVNQILGQTTADRAAADLKKQFRSSWTKNQIQEYLDPILLKMSAGEAFEEDVRMLAEVLVNSNSENMALDEDLAALRGATITISKGQLAELRGQHSSLKEIRARLAGTGIRVKVGERSSLTDDIEDMISEYGAGVLGELGDEKDALENFVSRVEERRNDAVKGNNYEERLADAYAAVMGVAAAVADDLYMPADNRAREQILELAEYVKGLRAETRAQQKTLEDIANHMEAMQKAGAQASNKSSLLMRDVNAAIDYYSRISKIAVDEAKQKRTSATIEMLKSEHAQKILKNNEEWRKLIERDRQARDQAEENMRARGRIDTALNRMFKLLKNPKGLNNIPEYMQGLAREVLTIFTDNDLNGGIKLTRGAKNQLAEARRLLTEWERQSGKFNLGDLSAGEEVVILNITNDLQTIHDGITAWNQDIRGKNKLDTLQQRGQILEQMADAVGEIYTAIKAEQEVQIGNRRVAVEDAAYKVAQGTKGKKYRERTGFLGQKITALHKFIVSGNMTPEYYFRMLGNEGLSDLWNNYHWAENRNGLELRKAQKRISELAEKYGYKDWNTKQKIRLPLESGETEITLGQMMSLWATWKREKTLGPAMSEHLAKGGFYAEKDLTEGVYGRTEIEKRAHRVNDADMTRIGELLTKEQKRFVDDVVLYMSRDMSELGNAASMAAYGIKLYKEAYYFPFQMWDGIKNRKSNDSGSAAGQDRAFHPSFSKSRMHGANNAIVIGDFMQTAADHITGMINYATMGLANESLNKVLNQKTAQGPYETQRNTRAILEEAYGREAMQYLMDLKVQLEGGAVRASRSFGDKAISMFRKNAVAGSMSVALQQPLSYIRAGMMISPKYMTKALMKEYWKGSYQELMEHSGVAVIKDMGRFDMNAGQSAREYLMPDGKESTARKVWDKAGEYSTILPEKMDAWTWTRMWVAVKAEQHAAHPEMDIKSDEFLDLCGERFNDIMRRTQVYDSTLVRSQNMRSDNYFMKGITSFMAEPTLSINVLADAVRSAKAGEAGGKALVGKAAATYILSAVLQAAIKAGMSTGRSPDERKTWWENFLYRFEQNMISEANPFSLIPGYSDAVDLLKDGEVSDDAMGAVGKLITAGTNTISLLLNGPGKNGLERSLEDSVAQLVQLFTNIPAKNLMRDARAMLNWIITKPYAYRQSSGAVIRQQAKAAFWNADSMIGAINAQLGEAGYQTTNKAYYGRMFDAMQAGNEAEAEDIREYLTLINDQDEKKIAAGLRNQAKAKLDEAESSQWSIDQGIMGDSSTLTTQYKKGKITREEFERMMKQLDPGISDDELWWKADQIEYYRETGVNVGGEKYYRLWDAMDGNKADEIGTAIQNMTAHGMDAKNIKQAIGKHYKDAYQTGSSEERRTIRDAMQKAYRKLGYESTDADKVIDGWTKDKSSGRFNPNQLVAGGGISDMGNGRKNAMPKRPVSEDGWDQYMEELDEYWAGYDFDRNDPVGQYGKGTIDLNHRKVIRNRDGSISTEKSFSFYDEDTGKEILIPTIVNGKELTEDEAIDHYYETARKGKPEYLGMFSNWKDADEYSMMLHNRNSWYYQR